MNLSSEAIKNFRITIVKAPPRTGKTHWCIERLVEAGSGNYVTHRHSIVEHALSIFKSIKEDATTVVRLKGKYQEGACIWSEPKCSRCTYHPFYNKERDEIVEWTKAVEKLVKTYKVINEDLINNINFKQANKFGFPAFCPYYTLREAEKHVDYCFTVVHFIDEITPRKLLVLDESPTIEFFFPRSVKLCTLSLTRKRANIENELDNHLKFLKKIKEIIEKKRESKEKGERLKDIDKYDKAILDIIEYLDRLNKFLDMREWERVWKEKDKIPELLPNPEEYEDFRDGILKRLNKYTFPDEYDSLALFEAILYPYEKWIYWQNSKNNHKQTLWLVGDATKPVFHIDNLKFYDKVIIIGGVIAEYFAVQIADEGECSVLENNDFPYAKNFIIIPVDTTNEDKEGDETKKKKRRRKRLLKIVKALREKGVPSIIFTGSKEKQMKILNSGKKMMYPLRDESVEEVKRLYFTGLIEIAYANSKISRGLDIPFINVCSIIDTDFAIPYWQARLQLAEEKKVNDDLAETVIDEIVKEETTNMALRISPVASSDTLQPKVLLISKDELCKIEYIKNRATEEVKDNLDKTIKMIKEIVGKRIEATQKSPFFHTTGNSSNSSKSENKMSQDVEGQLYYWEIPVERASFWRQTVETNSLIEAYNAKTSKSVEEVNDKTFNIIISHVKSILEQSPTRMSQKRLTGKIRKYYQIDQNKLLKILEEGCKRRIIKREKVNNNWLYSL